jgi:hypothetical protein
VIPAKPQPDDLFLRSSWARQRAFAFCVRSVAALLVLLLLAGTQSRSFALFRCGYTGVALTACCCPGAEEAETTPQISRACCCNVEQVEGSLPTAAQTPQTSMPLATAPLCLPEIRRSAGRVVIVEPLPSTGMRRYAERTRAGPSLTIVHRRLLI